MNVQSVRRGSPLIYPLKWREEPVEIVRQWVELLAPDVAIESAELSPPVPPAVPPNRRVPDAVGSIQKEAKKEANSCSRCEYHLHDVVELRRQQSDSHHEPLRQRKMRKEKRENDQSEFMDIQL